MALEVLTADSVVDAPAQLPAATQAGKKSDAETGFVLYGACTTSADMSVLCRGSSAIDSAIYRKATPGYVR